MADIVSYFQDAYSRFYGTAAPVVGETYLQLSLFTLGLALYAIFVWKFYRTLSKENLFKLNLEKYNLPYVKHRELGKIESSIAYALKYGIVFPLYIFFWFFALSLFLFVLSDGIPAADVLMLSIAVVSATRITSYYKEELAVDLAKLIPFSLLAVALAKPSFLSIELVLLKISEAPLLWSQVTEMLIFSVVLEWTLRSLCLLVHWVRREPADKRRLEVPPK
jgi:hypothetical protein